MPVSQEIKEYMSSLGKKGTEVRAKKFGGDRSKMMKYVRRKGLEKKNGK